MDEQNQDPIDAVAQDSSSNEPAQNDELAAANKRADEYMDGWRRAMADYANLKRETERLAGDLSKYAVAKFVDSLLPVVESFRKAAETRPAEGADPVKWIDGVIQIRNQLDSTLASAGVTAISEADVPFDPELHEAMLSETRDGMAAGTVLTVLEPGWKLHERVIRPAKVTVAE